MDPENYYNHNALKYARRTRSRLDTVALREFLEKLPPGGRILDAGCGAGRDLAVFSALGYQAEGFDNSQEMVRLAGETAPSARVWHADLRLLSVNKESYDGVWANRSLIHLEPSHCLRALASIFLALKPGGILFVTIDSSQETNGGNALETEDRTDDPQGPARKFFQYTRSDFASLIRQSGFRVLSEGRSTRFPERIAFLACRV